jgi:hypothetical protein
MDVVVVRDPADLVNTNVPAQVSFTGAQALFLGQQRNYLTEAIREKVKKNYSKLRGEFWFLAYSPDILSYEEDKDLKEAATLLA